MSDKPLAVTGETWSRAEFRDHLARELGITKLQAKAALDAFLAKIAQVALSGTRIELRGFGTFSLHHVQARTYRGIGGSYETPMTSRVHFQPGKSLKFKASK